MTRSCSGARAEKEYCTVLSLSCGKLFALDRFARICRPSLFTGVNPSCGQVPSRESSKAWDSNLAWNQSLPRTVKNFPRLGTYCWPAIAGWACSLPKYTGVGLVDERRPACSQQFRTRRYSKTESESQGDKQHHVFRVKEHTRKSDSTFQ